MEIKAKLNNLRIAPRKVRLVADLIRGKKIGQARAILDYTVKRGSLPLRKLLDSAIANAENNFKLDSSILYIAKMTVDEGPKMKRWMPRSRGQAYQIQKKTSHVTIVLDGKEKKLKTAKKSKVKMSINKDDRKEKAKQQKFEDKKIIQKEKTNKIFRRKTG